MSVHREKVDQARANTLKIARAAIRLKHSIAADTEINDVLPQIEAEFNERVANDELPDPLDIKKTLGV